MLKMQPNTVAAVVPAINPILGAQSEELPGVRELTPSEIDEVAGGPALGGLGIFAAGVGAGLVANWIWDSWGEEISEAGEAVYDTLCGH